MGIGDVGRERRGGHGSLDVAAHDLGQARRRHILIAAGGLEIARRIHQPPFQIKIDVQRLLILRQKSFTDG
jgi:hypothetical protein